ncbi:hypothetical protein [Microcoleus sp. F4-D5]|uniref:hypothetical protein n=1 Tax=Microcoleus sp. F4-D5 TaxID=2818760 RepID=UPI002FD5DD22
MKDELLTVIAYSRLMKYTQKTGFLYSYRIITDSVARNPVFRDLHLNGICCIPTAKKLRKLLIVEIIAWIVFCKKSSAISVSTYKKKLIIFNRDPANGSDNVVVTKK